MNKFFFSLIITTFVQGVTPFLVHAESSELNIEKKIQSFDEFEEARAKYDSMRESDLSDLLKERAAQKKIREKELEEYLLAQKKERKLKPEDTPAYEEFLLGKWELSAKREKGVEEWALEKKNFKPGKKTHDFERREYALQDTEKNRVPFKKRKPFGARSGGSSGRSGGFDSGASPYIPPPNIEDIPEFDNDIPPPPPPPPPMPPIEGEFDGGEPIPIPPSAPPME